jgi:hypothetical protein
MDNKLGKYKKCGFKKLKFFSGPVLTRGKEEEGNRNERSTAIGKEAEAFLSFSVVSLYVDCTYNKAFHIKPKLLHNCQSVFLIFMA